MRKIFDTILSYFADEYGQSKMYAEIGTSLVNLASNQTTIERYQCETFEKTEERWTQDYKDSEEKI